MIKPDHPVVILGAGPAGCSCAIKLAQQGLPVILLEKSKKKSDQPPQTVGADVMREISSIITTPLKEAVRLPLNVFYSSWGTDSITEHDFLFWNGSASSILDRCLFDNYLLDSAQDAGVTIFRETQLLAARWNLENWELELKTKNKRSSIRSCFIVEATGKSGATLVWPGVRRYFSDRLVSMSTECVVKNENIAMIEALPQGWVYTAPHPKGTQSICFFTDADLLPSKGSLWNWVTEGLNKTIQLKKNIAIKDKTGIYSCDARTSIRSVIWKDNWLCIGDAAWALDPLSGSGLQRSINDGLKSAVAIITAINDRSLDALRHHALKRASDFKRALHYQQHYYSIENRWSDELFWKRRAV